MDWPYQVYEMLSCITELQKSMCLAYWCVLFYVSSTNFSIMHAKKSTLLDQIMHTAQFYKLQVSTPVTLDQTLD